MNSTKTILSSQIEQVTETHGARVEHRIKMTLDIYDPKTGCMETRAIRSTTKDVNRESWLDLDGMYHYYDSITKAKTAFAIGYGADELPPDALQFLCENDQQITTANNYAASKIVSIDAAIDENTDSKILDFIADPRSDYSSLDDPDLTQEKTDDESDLLTMLLAEKTNEHTYPDKPLLLAALRQVMERLRKTKKDVVIMRGIAGLSNKEITKILNDERCAQGKKPYSKSIVSKHWNEFCSMVFDELEFLKSKK